ncbi:hypothetical protein BH09CHL1_BH09CHL1_35030 [soil metagenome]
MKRFKIRARIATFALALTSVIALAPMSTFAQDASPVATPTLQPVSELCANGGMAMTEEQSGDLTNVVGEFDLAFIDLMIVHHEGAIAMATIALERAEHPEIIELANAIVTSQSAEITQMRAWRDAWYPGVPQLSETQAMTMFDQAAATSPGMGGVPGASEMMMGAHDMMSLCDAEGSEFDLAFIDAMIPHHSGAILMAQAAQQYSTHQDIKDLAGEIISAQHSEIDGMNAWRSLWFPGTPVADEHAMEMATPSN